MGEAVVEAHEWEDGRLHDQEERRGQDGETAPPGEGDPLGRHLSEEEKEGRRGQDGQGQARASQVAREEFFHVRREGRHDDEVSDERGDEEFVRPAQEAKDAPPGGGGFEFFPVLGSQGKEGRLGAREEGGEEKEYEKEKGLEKDQAISMGKVSQRLGWA